VAFEIPFGQPEGWAKSLSRTQVCFRLVLLQPEEHYGSHDVRRCQESIMSEKGFPPSKESAEDSQQGRPIRNNLKSRATWLRLFFMLVVVLLYSVSRLVVSVVVVLQFFWVLFTGETNKRLEKLGQALATYTYQIIRYLTFNSEERPFPFDADWPAGPPQD
jgi:hypothetical protein